MFLGHKGTRAGKGCIIAKKIIIINIHLLLYIGNCFQKTKCLCSFKPSKLLYLYQYYKLYGPHAFLLLPALAKGKSKVLWCSIFTVYIGPNSQPKFRLGFHVTCITAGTWSRLRLWNWPIKFKYFMRCIRQCAFVLSIFVCIYFIVIGYSCRCI